MPERPETRQEREERWLRQLLEAQAPTEPLWLLALTSGGPTSDAE